MPRSLRRTAGESECDRRDARPTVTFPAAHHYRCLGRSGPAEGERLIKVDLRDDILAVRELSPISALIRINTE